VALPAVVLMVRLFEDQINNEQVIFKILNSLNREGHMSLSRATVAAMLVFLSPSAAFAQQPSRTENSGVTLPTCFQSLIERKWQGNFYLAQVNYGFSCPIGISSDGTLSFGNCVTAKM
jgi:hypothetical protein